MSKENITKENLYIYYNSLISISSISETNTKLFSKYLLRIDNLEQTLLLKKGAMPLYDFSDLKESLFYIRKIDGEENIENSNEDSLENKRINYNQQFILQHMISKKYISQDNLPGNNNYILRLTSNKESAVPFILKRIHETRSSQEFLTFKQSFYLSIFIKEKAQLYFINFNSSSEKTSSTDRNSSLVGKNNYDINNENFISNQNNQNNINNISNDEKDDDFENDFSEFNNNFSELSIEKKMNCKFIFLNQSWYEKYDDKLFSSHIINIVFVNSNLYKDSSKNNLITEKEEQLMLSAEYIDNINTEEIYDYNFGLIDTNEYIKKRKNRNYFYDENKGLINLNINSKKLGNQVRVKLVPYETDFYKHVINNSFWVIEEELIEHKERLERLPLKAGTQIKIKNVLMGLYLKVEKKGNEIEIEEIEQKIDENQNIDGGIKDNLKEEEEFEYEFELVDEETLKNNFFFSNISITHYSINEKDEYMNYKDKYALRNVFKDVKKEFDNFDFEEMNKYFQPLSINLDSEKKYYILPKNEDEFIFEIKKVDIFEANHVIYMNKLIKNFNFYLENCIKDVNSAMEVIISNLSFFINYLINVEYIFRDENYDINEPIEQRQVILENYGVLKSIRKIAQYLLPIIRDMNLKNKNNYQMRKSNYNRINNDNRSLYSSLISNKNIYTNRYRFDTLNEKINTNTISILKMKKLIRIILDFLTYLSNNNEEIKEKIFLDLDIILELAENVFVLDKSIMLNFIFKLIKHSETLQEYITGGKLNLLFTIKNSKHYTKFVEKENQNKLIRIDKILMYIETSNNYLYYYKKLLKLNKVKHKRDQIKQLIVNHMRKVEDEYKIKYNYKKNLINIINRTKRILKRIEENKEDYYLLKETNQNIKKPKTLDNIIATQKNNLINKTEKIEQEEKKSKNEITNLLNNEIESDNNKDNDSFSLLNNLSEKDENINQKTNIEENLKNIKLFLSFFEDFNINNTLFVHEKCYEEFFNNFNGIKNLKKNLDYVLGGKNKSAQLIDGIRLDPDSELGQIIPFNLFNRFFPKFLLHKNKTFNNYIPNYQDNFDEDSENDLYNNDLYNINEKPELEEDNIDNDVQDNKISNNFNFINKTKTFRSISQNIDGNMNLNKNIYSNQNIRDNKQRHSVTEDLNKLNRYLCILYTTYQFCINEFFECLLSILNMLNNYFINYGEFCDMKIFGKNMKKIRENLITKIAFINNDVLNNLYSSARKKPTLLKGVFDYDNFLESYSETERNTNNNLNENIDMDKSPLENHKFNKSNSNRIKSKTKEKKKIKDLIPEELTLIKSLFSFCKKYDKIIYIKDKFKCFRCIKNLINNIQDNNISGSLKNSDTLTSNELISIINNKDLHNKNALINNDINKIYIAEFLNIIEKLYKKRNRILAAYIDINNCKKDIAISIKKQKDKNLKDIKPFAYDINKRFEIIIRLMMKYEIDYLFGKLIYLGNNKNTIYLERNILMNFKSVQNNFRDIKTIIKKIKIDYDRRGDNCLKVIKNENNTIINQISFNESDFNKNNFQEVNICLAKMTSSFLNFLCMNSNSFFLLKTMPKLNKLLYKENDYFYQKIGFEKIMQNLIEAIDYFYDFYRNPLIKLNYCQEILRIFLEIQNIYKNFKETIPAYFDLYYKMIMSSLHSITLYQDNLIGKEEEKYFLKICFYSCESFMIVIFNSEKNFGDLRAFMTDILTKLLKIYSHLKNPKNKIIFQILYTYYILRVLLFISKEKYYDEFSYNSFFQIVYPMDVMHEQILCCMKELEKNEEEDDDSSEEKEITEESNLAREIKKKNIKPKSNINTFSNNINENENLNNNINDINTNSNETNNNLNYFLNNKYYQKYLQKKNEDMKKKNLLDNKSNKNNISNRKSIIQESNDDEEIIWENNEEKEKFCFYLNFLSIYLLYLHDRNSMKKIRDNINREIASNNIEYNYKNLYLKLQKILGNYEIQNIPKEQIRDIINLNLKTLNSAELSQKVKIELKESTLNTQNFEKIRKSKNNFEFESILVESIILYKYRLTNQNIEIPVKNRQLKNTEEEIISNADNEDKNSSLSGKIVDLRNKEMITFYYYDNEFIDLILLEKICNDLNLKETLDSYCTERNMINDYNFQKEDLMKVMLEMKEEFRLIMSYYKGENKILHDQYIQNDMEQFIMLLKTRFTNKDFNRIYSMKKFLYRKMNEIYSDDLYFGYETLYNKKIISFVEQFKLIEKLNYMQNSVYKNFSIYSYFTSLIYLYPRYPKKTCILYYIIGFKLLSQRCKQMELEENPYQKFNGNNIQNYQRMSKRETISLSQTKARNIEEKHDELDKIIDGFILLFSRKINRNVIQDDEDFFLMINSLIEFLKDLKRRKVYIMKRGHKITKLFEVLDFVFDHLFNDFEKIINFMKSAENQKMRDKFRKKETKLKMIIIFISTILSLQKTSDNNLLTNNIMEFIQNLTGQIIKLILILIEIGKEDSMKTCDMLIDFIYFFIEGPNINNLNSLFSYGFFNLLTFIITNIDYYKIFLNNINRENLHTIMDNFAKIEQKIIKIFFVYYNVSYNNSSNIREYEKVRNWYEKNYLAIKAKLKKLYHFSKVEMEKRSFNIDKALIYKKKKDYYSEEELFLRAGILNKSEIEEISFEEKLNRILNEDNLEEIQNYNLNNNSINENDNLNQDELFQNSNDNTKNITHKNIYCLIKFDLILIYYSLNLYYKDIINEDFFEVSAPVDSFLTDLWKFCITFLYFIKDVILFLPEFFIYLYRRVREKAKGKVELLQELNKIDEDIQNINEKDMLLDLSSKIKCVEISINKTLYKVYFPLINKAKKIEEKTDYYLYVENDDLPDYISHLIRNYDKIHISVTKNDYYDKLSKIPMLNLIFKNINLFGIFLMLIGILSNLLILLSYSDFNNDAECNCGSDCNPDERRLYCPRFFFNRNRNYITVNRALRVFGIIQLIFQSMVFLDYIVRNFSINYELSKRNYIIKKARITHQKSNINLKFFDHIKIIFSTFIHSITFQLIYYILYIFFTLLGLFDHPFFFAFSLFELLNRVEVMLAVLRAIYVQGLYLLVNLLMLIMLEYLFSLFSLSFFTSHFPNIKDSKNFLQTYMRMLDQTFKQDGGIGTYLDQSLDPNYVQYTPRAYAGGRYWFDLIFYICIILVIFQIFVSIIIDYFMDTRKNREDFAKKSKTECLICGLKRENIEKIYLNIKDGFNKHRVYCHHIMNYINYLFYVQSLSYRDPIIEQGIWNYHLDNNNNYLPIKTCFQMKERKIQNIINESKDKDEEFK